MEQWIVVLSTNFDLFQIFSKRAGKRHLDDVESILRTIQPTGSSSTDRL